MASLNQQYIAPAALQSSLCIDPSTSQRCSSNGYALRHKPTRSVSVGDLSALLGDRKPDLEGPRTMPVPLRNPSNSGAFVYKLYNMLEDPASQHLISFSSHGKSFVVANASSFSKEVLNMHFKHSNFSSFVRQCNMYGFHKVNKTPRGQRGSIEAQAWEFSHPKFIKGRPDLLESIKRKTMDDSLTVPFPETLTSAQSNSSSNSPLPPSTFSDRTTLVPSYMESPITPFAFDAPDHTLTTKLAVLADRQHEMAANIEQLAANQHVLQQALIESREREDALCCITTNLYCHLQQQSGMALPFEMPNYLYPSAPIASHSTLQATMPHHVREPYRPTWTFSQHRSFSSQDFHVSSGLPPSPITPLQFSTGGFDSVGHSSLPLTLAAQSVMVQTST